MSRCLYPFLIMCLALSPAWPAGINSVPVVESFESYSNGFDIVGALGWSTPIGGAEVSTNADIVNALTNYTGAGGTFPLDTTHDKVLSCDGLLTHAVDGPVNRLVKSDFMWHVRLHDVPGTLDDSHHLGLFFNTNGLPKIFHRDVIAGSNVWITLTNGPTITSQTWNRITFLQDYSNHLYQVSVNGNGPISDARGWDGPLPGGTQPGPWFFMPATNGVMSSISFDGGKAYLDDLLIGSDLAAIETVSATSLFSGMGDLQGFLSYTGFSAASIEVYWGTADGGTNASDWAATNFLTAPQAVGNVTIPISGFEANQVNYFRFAAVNAAGRNWASSSESFTLVQTPLPSHSETNVVPFAESFESYDNGFSIDDALGWFFGEEADSETGRVTTNPVVVNALTNYTGAGGTLPLNTTHEKVLCLGGPVQLSIASPMNEPVRTDCMYMPFLAHKRPQLDSGYQFGLIFNSNGVAEVFHRNTVIDQNEWITLSNAPTISSQTWTRVTIFQDYSNHMCQVSINESGPISDPGGWTGPGGSQPGPWFFMPSRSGRMAVLGFDGGADAYLDDLVIGGLLPLIDTLEATNVTAGSADLNGFLSYTGLDSTAVEVYWGQEDGGTDTTAWEDTNSWSAPQAPGPYSFHVTGLGASLYNYRYAAINTFGRHWAENTKAFLFGDVNVEASDPDADEDGFDTGTFTIYRPPGGTNGDLVVNFSLGGSADNGVDYDYVTNPIVIPAGQSNVVITVTPIFDFPGEGPETVRLTLASGPYGIGASSNATVTIADRLASELVWDNDDGFGDRSWNSSSPNWVGGELFVLGDEVRFTGIEPGDVYIGDGITSNPVNVLPSAVTVKTATYTFSGGRVQSGEVQVQSNGRLVHTELGQKAFGSRIHLQGGEFWRTITPDNVDRSQTFMQDIIIEAQDLSVTTNLLNGTRGNNFWRGHIELGDRLNLNFGVAESVDHENIFTGTITINQDTNNTNERIVYHQGQDGNVYFQGPIIDDTNQMHDGQFPLKINSRSLAQDIHFQGTNTYSHGTIVAYWDPVGNATSGVLVQPGSSLGTGPVTVEGIAGTGGALLTLNAVDAVRGALNIQPQARVIVNATNAISQSAGTITVGDGASLELNNGQSIDDLVTLSLIGTGTVVVLTNTLIEVIGALTIDGINQGFGFFTAAEFPANIIGAGSIRVPQPNIDALMFMLR